MALYDGLVAYWKFQFGGTTWKDSGPHGMHATKTGTVNAVAASIGNGAQPTAAAGNYLNVPADPRHKLHRNCTISMIIKVVAYANGSIMSKVGGTYPHGFRTETGPNAFHITEGGANKFTITGAVPADGNYHAVVVTHNGTNGMECFVDGVSQGTAVSGDFWFGVNQPIRFGAPSASFYGSGTAAANVIIDEVAMWNRVLSGTEISNWWTNSGSNTPLPQNGITLDEVGDYLVYQRNKDGSLTKSITRSGNYTTGTPTTIEFAAYDHTDGVTIVQDWTPMTGTTISGGAWSGTVTIPQHSNWCAFKVRSKDAGGSVLETSVLSLGHVGVGAIFHCAGQSNMAHMFDWYTSTFTNSKTGLFNSGYWIRNMSPDGSTYESIGSGMNVLLDKLQQALNCPVAAINTAIGGTGLYQGDGGDYWLDLTAGKPYALSTAALTAAGGDCEMILWHQGEADAHSATSQTNHYNSLTTLYSRFLSAIGRTAGQCPIGIGSLATLNDGSTAANTQGIRAAQILWAYATTGAFYLGSNIDAVRFDNYHYDTASYQRIAKRWAQSVACKLGLLTKSGEGPKLIKAFRRPGSAIVHVLLDMKGSTALVENDGATDGNGLTGFSLTTDNWSTTLTISSTEFRRNQILITLSAAPADTATLQIRYLYGAVPTITEPAYGDLLVQGDTVGLPVQPFTSDQAVILSVGAKFLMLAAFMKGLK